MWSIVKIKDLGKVVTGSTPPTNRPENYGSGYHFIKPPDLHDGRRKIFVTQTEISEVGAQTQCNRLLPANTPFVVCIGTIGKLGLTTRPSFTNQQINSIIVDKSRHDPVFVYYLLRITISKVKKLNAGSASGRENVNKSTFENIEVCVPPLDEQQRIAAVLSVYDDLIENNQRRIQILEAMARALYREWFVQENFPSESSDIDFSFKRGTLGDLCGLTKERFKDDIHSARPLLDLSRMPQHSIAPLETGQSNGLTTSRILFEKGDTLFGAIRCYLHKVVAAHFPGVTNTSVLVLRPSNPFFRALVAVIASDPETIRWAETHSTGTKMPVINGDLFKTMPVPIPSGVLAQYFESIAGPMLDQIGILATQMFPFSDIGTALTR